MASHLRRVFCCLVPPLINPKIDGAAEWFVLGVMDTSAWCIFLYIYMHSQCSSETHPLSLAPHVPASTYMLIISALNFFSHTTHADTQNRLRLINSIFLSAKYRKRTVRSPSHVASLHSKGVHENILGAVSFFPPLGTHQQRTKP